MLAAVAVALCGATPAAGLQSVAEPAQVQGEISSRGAPRSLSTMTAAQLTARLDSLRLLLDDARLAQDARQRRDNEALKAAAAAVAAVDTIRVGLVTVVTPVDQVALARELFTEAWGAFPFVDRSPTLDEAVFSFQWSDRPVPIHIEAHPRSIHVPASTKRADVEGAIRAAIAATVNFDLRRSRAEIAAWVTGDPLRPPPLEQTYRFVATSRSKVGRACMTGEIDACRSGLALGTTRDLAQIRAWYTPDERRAMIARSGMFASGRLDGARWGECVEGRDIAVCDALLADSRRDWSPFGFGVRETVLAYAIEQGGDGSWSRLFEDPQMEPARALEHVSGMELHDLLVGWHARLMEHRPATFANLVPSSGLTLLWILFFVGLAMRSTRWRFG